MMNPDKTQTRIDRATHTITFERTVTAPREQVFDAWTRAEHLTHWWDPTGAPLAACAVDLRPGGTFTFTHQDSAHGPPFSGTYVAIERPARLVFEAMGAVGTVQLEGRGDETRMTVSIRCGSAEHLETFVRIGVADGTARTLDNLARYVR